MPWGQSRRNHNFPTFPLSTTRNQRPTPLIQAFVLWGASVFLLRSDQRFYQPYSSGFFRDLVPTTPDFCQLTTTIPFGDTSQSSYFTRLRIADITVDNECPYRRWSEFYITLPLEAIIRAKPSVSVVALRKYQDELHLRLPSTTPTRLSFTFFLWSWRLRHETGKCTGTWQSRIRSLYVALILQHWPTRLFHVVVNANAVSSAISKG